MWLLLPQTSFKAATVFHSIALRDLMSIFQATSTVSYATSLDLTIFEPMYVIIQVVVIYSLTQST